MYSHPPPLAPRKTTPWGLIIALLLVGVVVVVGLCGVGAYLAMKSATGAPKERSGFGKPVVQAQLDGGWSQYRFPEIPMTMELPIKPTVDHLLFEPGDKFLIDNWTFYSCVTDWNAIDFVAQWYYEPARFTMQEETEYIDGWWKDSYEAKDYKSDVRKAKFGRLEGYIAEGSFLQDEKELFFIAYAWSKGKRGSNLFFSYYPEYEKEAKKEMQRIINSIREF
jgi:hypothetical protein